MDSYVSAVGSHLTHLSKSDQRLALESLDSSLAELKEIGIDPVEALGSPHQYAAQLVEALEVIDPSEEPHLRLLGLPVETRGPVDARVRSRTWNPQNPSIIVPRLLGVGWTLNLGALAVRLNLIRPDDATSEVIDQIPMTTVRWAQRVPLGFAGGAIGALVFSWSALPEQVASSFALSGKPTRTSHKRSLLSALMMGLGPALWAMRKQDSVEERLVGAASATTLAAISTSVIIASVLTVRYPNRRWGLIIPAGLGLGVVASLGTIVIPVRSGLRQVWAQIDSVSN